MENPSYMLKRNFSGRNLAKIPQQNKHWLVAFFSDGLIIIALWIIYNVFFVMVIAFQKQVKGLKI